MGLTRRRFLTAVGISAVGAVAFAGCSAPGRKFIIQSPNKLPEDLVSGIDNWYATIHPRTGDGIIVRVMEGRAKKIEGNPDYPATLGKSSAHTQAGLQMLYHPDRIQGPMSRANRQGAFGPVSWDDGFSQVASRLSSLSSRPEGVVIITGPLRGHLAMVVDKFTTGYGATHLTLEPMEETSFRAASKAVFGQDMEPIFDIGAAAYVLSIGGDFLGRQDMPVQYDIAYGEFRQGEGRRRGHLVQVEPRFSLTAANADRWVPVTPGSEGLFALSVAQVMVAEGLGNRAAADTLTGGRGAAALDAFRPDAVAGATGVPADAIREIAREFAQAQPAIAIGGSPAGAYTNGQWNLTAILALNLLVDNVNKPGGVRFGAAPPIRDLPATRQATTEKAWEDLVKRLQGAQGAQPVELVLVHGADPVHDLPAGLAFKENLGHAPAVVSFSSIMDETSQLADLILPSHTFLEDWGSEVAMPGPGYATVGVQQPVVAPFANTRSFGDMLLSLAGQLGGRVKDGLPWANMREAVRDGVRQLQQTGKGSVQGAGDFESYWHAVLQRGGWWDDSARGAATPRPAALNTTFKQPNFAGDAGQYPYYLSVFPTFTDASSEAARLPWLQALGDTLSTVSWHTWVEMSPEVARDLGVVEGDLVEVESLFGKIQAPAYINPAARPDVVSIPIDHGYGGLDRYKGESSTNVMTILAPMTDEDSGALAWGATRVRLRRTGEHVRPAKYEGTVVPTDEEHHIVQITGPA